MLIYTLLIMLGDCHMGTLKFIKEKANNLVYKFERKKFLYSSIILVK